MRVRPYFIGCLAVSALLLSGVAEAAFTERVSVSSGGVEADGQSKSATALSVDGRYVAFISYARNLSDVQTVDEYPGFYVYVRDRVAGTTERADVKSNGTGWYGASNCVAISADGRYVAFDSGVVLTDGERNGSYDIFVHDRETGTTERMNVSLSGDLTPAGWWCAGVAISGDGQYVAFASTEPDLVEGDTNGQWDVFVRDPGTGTTERVSISSTGEQANSYSGWTDLSLSADGRHVAFASDATNLVAGDTNSQRDVFVHDREAGTTERVSVSSAGEQGDEGSSEACSLSADGQYVAFTSWATNLVDGDTNGIGDVFVHDRVTGTTERVSVSSEGEQAEPALENSIEASLSADGRYVAFGSWAPNLVAGDTNGLGDVFVHDRLTGVTERVSISTTGEQGSAVLESTYWSCASISADGRVVAFASEATSLVDDDTNGLTDTFVRVREGFVDVYSAYWAYDEILACVQAGIVTGFTDGSYRPTVEVTRDQMAVYMARALCGGDAYVPTGAHAVTFADVPADHWAFRYVEYCSDASIVAGYDDGYRPSVVVDRAQMAVYVARSIVDPTGEAGLTGYTPPTTASFSDVPTDYWAYKHIEYCKAQGIVSGYGADYRPENVVTRDQMAVYVARAFGVATVTRSRRARGLYAPRKKASSITPSAIR